MSASQIYLGSSHLIVRNIHLMNFFSIVWILGSTKIVEQELSINKSLVKVNMKEDTILAKKIICDYMLANSLKPQTVGISNKLILSCSTVHQKYHKHIEDIKKLTGSNKRESEIQSLINEINSY